MDIMVNEILYKLVCYIIILSNFIFVKIEPNFTINYRAVVIMFAALLIKKNNNKGWSNLFKFLIELINFSNRIKHILIDWIEHGFKI